MDYEKFKIKREQNQIEASILFENLNEGGMLFIESPTGSGKTHIALKAAAKYKNKYDKSVIITTNTNNNVLALKKIFQTTYESLKLESDDLTVEIGKNNYIDLDRLVDSIKKFKKTINIPGLTYENIKNKYSINIDNLEVFKNDVLIEDFIKDMNISSEKSDIVRVFCQDSDITINPKELKSIEDNILNKKIIVMNHSYFLILYRYYGNHQNRTVNSDFRTLFFETPVIFDEFHTLFDAAKSILSNSFSLFRLKYSIEGVLKNINKDGNITLIKNLNSFLSNVIVCQDRINKNQDKALEHLSSLKLDITSKKSNSVIKKLLSIQNETFNSDDNSELNKYIRFLRSELNELNIINMKAKGYMQLSFSPKGFPKIVFENGFPSYKLRDIVWNRINGAVLGLSGTLRTEDTRDKKAFQWVIKRNGLFKKNNENFKSYLSQKKDLDESFKETLIAKNTQLNNRIEKAEYKIYDSLFEKGNFIYTIIEHDKFTRPKVSETAEEKIIGIDKWRFNIAKFIGSNIKYNSLILTTSYDDVEKIAKIIKDDRPDIKIFFAEEGRSMNNLVEKFKINAKKHVCCLIGTEQYYTGLDLKGDLLLELYLVKIPFKPYKGQVGMKVFPDLGFTKNENYYNETYFKFMQGVGRPIRDYKDKAVMYILDPRINDGSRLQFRKFLSRKAIKVSYLDMNIKYKDGLLKENKHSLVYTNIYTLFFSYLMDKSINEINKMFDIKTEEMENINIAVKKILETKYTIEQIFDSEYFFQLIETKSYKDIWLLLLKIYTVALEKKGIDLRKEIHENNMYEFDNLVDVAKYILSN